MVSELVYEINQIITSSDHEFGPGFEHETGGKVFENWTDSYKPTVET
jgi:hypothetical protein